STPEVGGTKQPNNASWSSPATQVLAAGGATFDSSGASHPAGIKDRSTYVMYFTGDSSGTLSIGRATSATAGGAFTGDTQVLVAGAAGEFGTQGAQGPGVGKGPPAGDR